MDIENEQTGKPGGSKQTFGRVHLLFLGSVGNAVNAAHYMSTARVVKPGSHPVIRDFLSLYTALRADRFNKGSNG